MKTKRFTIFIWAMLLSMASFAQDIEIVNTVESDSTAFQDSLLLITFQIKPRGDGINYHYNVAQLVLKADGQRYTVSQFSGDQQNLLANKPYELYLNLNQETAFSELYRVEGADIGLAYHESTLRKLERQRQQRETREREQQEKERKRRQGQKVVQSLFGFNRSYERLDFAVGAHGGAPLPELSAVNGTNSYGIEDTRYSWALEGFSRFHLTNYLSFQLGLKWLNTEFTYIDRENSYKATLRFRNWQVPAVVNLHLGPRLSVHAGVYYSRNTDPHFIVSGDDDLKKFFSPNDFPITRGEEPVQRHDVGYLGGIEYRLDNHFFFGLRYEQGLNNFFNEAYADPIYGVGNINLTNANVSVYAGIFLLDFN